MVLAKKWQFFHFYILVKIGQANVSHDILERKKNSLIDYRKSRSKKSPKVEVLPKGLVYGFGQKLAPFPSFYFRQNRPGKCVLGYSGNKKRFLDYKNNNLKRSNNWYFSKF